MTTTSTRELALADILTAVATAVPERECIACDQTRVTFATLHDRVQGLASFLVGAGFGVSAERSSLHPYESGQDHLAILMENCVAFAETTFAAFAARMAPLTINFRYTAAELAHVLEDARPRVVVVQAKYVSTLEQALQETTFARPLTIVVGEAANRSTAAVAYETAVRTPHRPLPAASPDDLCVLYTGGTTGYPKGVLWRQGDLWKGVLRDEETRTMDSAAEIGAWAAGVPGRRVLGAAPFMHGAGWWILMGALLNGGFIAIPTLSGAERARGICESIARERLTTVNLVGEAFARPFIDEIEARGLELPSVRTIVFSGGPTTAVTKRRIQRAIPGAQLVDSAGSSETGGLLTAPFDATRAEETVSFHPRERAIIVSADRSRILSPQETEVGWLAARGALPLGYLGDRVKTEETFRRCSGERVAIPGDRARWLPGGTIQLLGRDSITINSGGEKIYAEEVEEVLRSHPLLADAVVVGRPHERWGNEVVAVIQEASPTSDEDLRHDLAQRLARYKLPKAFIRVDQLRRSPAGKPDYVWARQLAESPSRTP
ncbi:acyl-CoA synthetase [Aeromicrobium phragmitis]|uniref:Acyl-CoA synthetase n=1 Tax=Aeromicrobium phragmitis TaxID=2478914 RepID=A0A3L8PPE0_9ACTN|nr:AMP-binding protein [Aeromicrobium phragmitis]RLV57256.1 acyl-CoA synthetase [Aeromicrobium phragmitis]